MPKYYVVKKHPNVLCELHAKINEQGEFNWYSDAGTLFEREDAIKLVEVLQNVNSAVKFSVKLNESKVIIGYAKNITPRYVSHVNVQAYADLDMQVGIFWTSVKKDALKLEFPVAEKYVKIIKTILDIDADIVNVNFDVVM